MEDEETGECRIPWIWLGLIGGLIGELTAVASLKFGVWWLWLKGAPATPLGWLYASETLRIERGDCRALGHN